MAEPNEIAIPPTAVSPTSPTFDPISPSTTGSFYGRRDFENRHDLDDNSAAVDSLRKINRQPSLVGTVLDRIKSRIPENSIDSDTDNEDEEDSD